MSPENSAKFRRDALGLLARSPSDALSELFANLPPHQTVRAAEIGTVMVRARAGATGAAFNLGEMTVTRASIRLDATGTIGHGYVQGRDKTHAQRAACIDALAQDDPAWAEAAILSPLRKAEANARSAIASDAAGTRVEFFTLVRGEDE